MLLVIFLCFVIDVLSVSVEEYAPNMADTGRDMVVEVPSADGDTIVQFDGILKDGFVFTQGDICIMRYSTRGLLELEDLLQYAKPNYKNNGKLLLNKSFLKDADHVDYRMLGLKTGLKLLSSEIDGSHWPCPIPYEIDDADRGDVEDAIEHWEESTPWRFEERTGQTDYIEFIDGSGCASWVGRQGGKQEIWLNSACSVGNAIHEIGHAIGFYHEHARIDRDTFVEIIEENILDGYEGNFNKNDDFDTNDIGQYDYGSIMHYPEDAFAEEPGDITIRAIRTIPSGVTMGQREELSSGDIGGAIVRHDEASGGGCDDSVSPAPPVPPTPPIFQPPPTSVPTVRVASSISPISPISSITEESISPSPPPVPIPPPTPPPTLQPLSPVPPPSPTASGSSTEEEESTESESIFFTFSPAPPPSPVDSTRRGTPSPETPISQSPITRIRRTCTRGVCVYFDNIEEEDEEEEEEEGEFNVQFF